MSNDKSFSHEVLRKMMLAPDPSNPHMMIAILDREDPSKGHGLAYPVQLVAPPLRNLLVAAPFMYQEMCRYYDTMQQVVDAIDKVEHLIPGGVAESLIGVRTVMEAMQIGILNVQAVVQKGLKGAVESLDGDKPRKPT